MNAFDREIGREMARLHFGDGDFAILNPGLFVLCAAACFSCRLLVSLSAHHHILAITQQYDLS
jgi:hypothetical protein